MKLYFVRHGESEANILHEVSNRGLKHGLTERGRQEAVTLAGKLKGVPATRIYSSPLLRAVQTSQILSRALTVPLEITDALREYDCGVIEGKSDAVSWEMHSAVAHDWLEGRWESRVAGGESYLDIQARFVPFIEQLVGRYRRSRADLVLVGHGGLYRHMLPLVLTNVDAGFAFEHLIGHTEVIVAESRLEGLFCLSWCDIAKHQKPTVVSKV
jgi:broad specificity phosphatase PhoE